MIGTLVVGDSIIGQPVADDVFGLVVVGRDDVEDSGTDLGFEPNEIRSVSKKYGSNTFMDTTRTTSTQGTFVQVCIPNFKLYKSILWFVSTSEQLILQRSTIY